MYRHTGIRYNTELEIKKESEYVPVRSNLEELKKDREEPRQIEKLDWGGGWGGENERGINTFL